jgi:hypothetical protein
MRTPEDILGKGITGEIVQACVKKTKEGSLVLKRSKPKQKKDTSDKLQNQIEYVWTTARLKQDSVQYSVKYIINC